MVQDHGSAGIDQYVSSELVDVTRRRLWTAPARDQPEIGQPRGRSPDRPPPAAAHAVGRVQPARRIDQEGPAEPCLADIQLGRLRGLEADDENAQTKSFDLVFVPSQLRQVLAARQSAKVSVKRQQQPTTLVLLEPMQRADRIHEFERHRPSSSSLVHR